MYCTNCGKEVKESYKYCNNCGSEIETIEKNEKKYIQEDVPKENCFGMRYFKFFSTVYLTIVAIISIINMINYRNIEEWNIYITYNLILDIMLYIIIPIKLLNDLPKRTLISYILVLIFLISDYVYKVIMVSIATYINNPYTNVGINILLLVIIYGIWFIPNIIYFVKRRKVFTN